MNYIKLVTAEYAERQNRRAVSECPQWWHLLDQVFDPELPAVSIWDLGILHDVKALEDGTCHVLITPTYSGCPAVDIIKQDVEACLLQGGIESVLVEVILSPAWNTELISPQGKVAMQRQGIAPPDEKVICPQCHSEQTQLLSQFGSTACKALYRCGECLEPFDYFKAF